MKEALKNVRFNLTLSAVLTVILGIVLIFWPDVVLTSFAKLVGIGLIIAGVVMLSGVLFGQQPGLLGGIITLGLGIWAMSHAQTIVSVFPMIAGILMIVHAVQGVILALESRQLGSARWAVSLGVAALTGIFGLMCLLRGFGVVSMIVSVIGIMLVYDGLTDIFVVRRVTQARQEAIIDGEIIEEKNIE